MIPLSFTKDTSWCPVATETRHLGRSFAWKSVGTSASGHRRRTWAAEEFRTRKVDRRCDELSGPPVPRDTSTSLQYSEQWNECWRKLLINTWRLYIKCLRKVRRLGEVDWCLISEQLRQGSLSPPSYNEQSIMEHTVNWHIQTRVSNVLETVGPITTGSRDASRHISISR